MCGFEDPAGRRYTLRLAAAMLAYMGLLFLSLHLLRTRSLDGALLVAVAAAPALPVMAAIACMGLFIKEMTDEYQRMRLIRSMLIATGLSLGVATFWAFLENAGAVQRPPVFFAFPLWCVCLGLAQGAGKVLDR